MLNFGIIGYGYMGHVHGATISKLEGARLLAVCDLNPTELENAPEGIQRFTTANELLAIPEIDVVIIAANNNQHLDLVCKSAKAGKDIICEKPVAMSVAELDKMIEACERGGVRFTVHQQRRYDKDYRTVKEIYDRKSLGDVYTIQTSLYGYNGYMHDWHVKKDEGGGMLYDWGVHLLDQLLWMVDSPVKSVYAYLRNVINDEVDDYFNITLRFENGIMAQLKLGTYFLTDRPGWFSRHWFMGGHKGSLYVDGMNPKGNIVRTSRLRTGKPVHATATSYGPTRSFGPPPDGLLVTEPIPEVNTEHIAFFHNYLRAYNGEEEFLVRIPEVRRVLALMEAIWESARTGQSVHFE